MEELVVEKVEAKEAQLHATYDEKLRNSQDRLVIFLLVPSRQFKWRTQIHLCGSQKFELPTVKLIYNVKWTRPDLNSEIFERRMIQVKRNFSIRVNVKMKRPFLD